MTINTHHLEVDFGKYNGTLWTRVPVSYLLWIVSQLDFNQDRRDIAQAELDRRGTTVPEVDLSGHAIDRASESCWGAWKRDRNEGEGFHSWLCRVALEAYRDGWTTTSGRKLHQRINGMEFAFEDGTAWPVVKTIIKKEA